MAPTKLEIAKPTGVGGLESALLARARRAVSAVTSAVDERTAADAVSAASDTLVLLRLLERPEVLESLRAADPLAPARLRGIEARRKLADLAGGLLSSEEASNALDLTRQAIEKRRRAGRLLAVSLGKRGNRYPAFQFVDGRTLPGLERVLDALKHCDDWTRLAFFVNRRADLAGKAPVALLRAGKVNAVVEAAEASVDHGAA